MAKKLSIEEEAKRKIALEEEVEKQKRIKNRPQAFFALGGALIIVTYISHLFGIWSWMYPWGIYLGIAAVIVAPLMYFKPEWFK
ncbi:hypothetical protein HYV81_04725 [Candidatus Woesearchaeota archaeon]|nr:hypothetical protein [Candidatus Woesearchaeota archaeon]